MAHLCVTLGRDPPLWALAPRCGTGRLGSPRARVSWGLLFSEWSVASASRELKWGRPWDRTPSPSLTAGLPPVSSFLLLRTSFPGVDLIVWGENLPKRCHSGDQRGSPRWLRTTKTGGSNQGRAQRTGRAPKSWGSGVFSELGSWSHRGNGPDMSRLLFPWRPLCRCSGDRRVAGGGW